MRILSKLALLLLFVNTSSFGADRVVRIQITSSWDGLGKPAKKSWTIKNKAGSFSSGRTKVDKDAIEGLLVAIGSPAMERPTLSALGITQSWLDENADVAMREHLTAWDGEPSSEQKELFTKYFTNYQFVEGLLPRYYASFWTDDAPYFHMEISWENGRKVTVASQAAHQFMVPWRVTSGSEEFATYSTAISRAIYRLMPAGVVNRGRIGGKAIRPVIREEVMREIQDQWNLLDSERRIGKELAALKPKFTLLKSQVYGGCIMSFERDFCQPWDAELLPNTSTPNVRVRVSLPYRDGKLVGFDDFLLQVSHFTDLALSAPWLARYLETHPEVLFEVRYVEGRSVTPKAARSFLDDMRKHGRTELADYVESRLASSSSLTVRQGDCWSYWIVLPTQEMVLWLFNCPTVMNRPASEFTPWDTYGSHATGALHSPGGEVKLSR